jgi:hypothetical protein
MKALAMTTPHQDVDSRWQICPPHHEHPEETFLKWIVCRMLVNLLLAVFVMENVNAE